MTEDLVKKYTKLITTSSIVLMSMVSSCTNKTEKSSTNVRVIEFPQKLLLAEDNLSKLELKDIELVKLKNQNDNSIIGSTDAVFFRNDFIYIVDKSKEQAISIFNKQGDFIKKLSKVGGASDEYKLINDVQVNLENGNIEIMANDSHKMLFFDSLGVFKNQIALNYSGLVNFLPFKGRYFFYNSLNISNEKDRRAGLGYRLSSADEEYPNKIVHQYLPFSFYPGKEPNAIISQNNFVRLHYNKDTVVIFERLCDTIYNITKNGVSPRFLIRYEGEKKKSEILVNKNLVDKSETINKERITTLISWLENRDYVLMTYSCYDKNLGYYVVRFAFYNKRIKENIAIGKSGRLLVDINGSPFHLYPIIMPQFINDKGKFVTILSPVELNRMLELEKLEGNLSGPIHQLCKKNGLGEVKAEDNPILFMYNLSANK